LIILKNISVTIIYVVSVALYSNVAFSEVGYNDSDGVIIHYPKEGQVDALILIHGFTASATLLPDGRVLLAGGKLEPGTISSCEIYEPSSGAHPEP
jgi:hypothetical protein